MPHGWICCKPYKVSCSVCLQYMLLCVLTFAPNKTTVSIRTTVKRVVAKKVIQCTERPNRIRVLLPCPSNDFVGVSVHVSFHVFFFFAHTTEKFTCSVMYLFRLVLSPLMLLYFVACFLFSPHHSILLVIPHLCCLIFKQFSFLDSKRI